jgi:hypothetical protein
MFGRTSDRNVRGVNNVPSVLRRDRRAERVFGKIQKDAGGEVRVEMSAQSSRGLKSVGENFLQVIQKLRIELPIVCRVAG